MSERVLEHGLDTKPEMTFTLDTTATNILPTDPTLRDAIPMLSRLVRDPEFLQSHVWPLLEEAGRAEDWYVAYRHDDSDRSCSLQVFVWPPGSATSIHDHSSWGAFCCVVGSILEERYERADDGSLPEYARLKKLWRLSGEGRMGSRPFSRMMGAFTAWATRPRSQPSRCTFTVHGLVR